MIGELSLAQIIAYSLWAVVILFVIILSIVNRKEFWVAIKGGNGVLQVTEMAAMLWLILVPTMIISDIFGLPAGDEPWKAIDFMGFVIFGAKTAMQFKKKDPEKPKDLT